MTEQNPVAARGGRARGISLTGLLFPRLPHNARAPFTVALATLPAMLIVFALLRWQAPLITLSAVGLSLLFGLYLYEAGIHRDVGLQRLVLTAVLATGLGIGWVLLTHATVPVSHDIAFGPGAGDQQNLLADFGILLGSAVLMLVPPVLARLARPGDREPLTGFVFGALSAVVFTAAATLARLGPQFTTGVTARDRPVDVLLEQAGIQGVALPLTAAALGGLVGIALWRSRPWPIVVSVVVVLGLYAAMGLTEVPPGLADLHLWLHAAIAIIALLALWIGQRAAVPREGPEPTDHTVALTHTRLLTALGAGVGVVVAAGVTAAALATPAVARFVCPPDCGRPPIGDQIESNPRFVSSDGAFTVQYPGPGTAYEATLEPDGVTLEFVGGDTGTMQLFGMPAQHRTPKQIAEALLREHYPDAITDYEIPNAMVGYEPGYGVIVDEYPKDAGGTFSRLRLILMVAVKYDYALVAGAIGPYHEFSPDFGTGHPSGANLQLALDMGKYVNSFRWRDLTG